MANAPNFFVSPKDTSPANQFIPVTVGSVTGGFRALFVGTLGDILITGFDDVSATFTNCQSGSILPVTGKAIGTTASGTTATGLVAIR